MAEVVTEDAVLHVEVDGDGEPVTVLAHGLTNSCRELAPLTPLVAGTKVRFCFRGHGHSSAPDTGYRFADFARDVEAVAGAYGATRAVGTSLGAAAICNLLARVPDRFERLVFVLPAGLDRPFRHRERFLTTAEILETMPREEAVEALLSAPDRQATYARTPWLRDLDRQLWSEINAAGVSRAIREVTLDVPLADREALRRVEAPTLLICREGDVIHPASVGRDMAALMPRAELLMYPDEVSMIEAIPYLVQRVAEHLAPA